MAKLAGCELVSVRQVAGELVGEFMCPDVEEGRPLATATLLEGLTAGDATADPPDPSLVLAIQSAGELAPQAAHAYVLEHVRFRAEEVETFARPSATLRAGAGDCDDSERVLVSLARACGIGARYVYFLQGGQPAHVTAQLQGLDGAWRWAETTIPARFGEHPFAAMRRLGMTRADLDGVPILLHDGRAVPLTSAGGIMMGDLVDRIATPITAQTLLDALAAAWPSAVGGSPGQALQVLVAQSAFETGAWAAVWNYNLGNVKYTGNTDYFTMTASEGSGASTTYVASEWRSYPTLAAGAAAWLAFLAANYSAALGYAEQGDVANFVASLKSSGYFTGDASDYTAGVQRYYTEYGSLTPSTAAAVSLAGRIALLAVSVVAGVVVAVVL